MRSTSRSAADGTIYVAEYGGSKITYFRPNETPVSSISVTAIAAGGRSGGGRAGGDDHRHELHDSAGDDRHDRRRRLHNVVVQNSTTITGDDAAAIGAALADVMRHELDRLGDADGRLQLRAGWRNDAAGRERGPGYRGARSRISTTRTSTSTARVVRPGRLHRELQLDGERDTCSTQGARLGRDAARERI